MPELPEVETIRRDLERKIIGKKIAGVLIYVDSDGNKGNFVKFLKVYGRGGLKCRRCSGVVKKVKQGGRGTHYCPECQI